MKKRLILLSGVALLAVCSCSTNKQEEVKPVYDPSAVDSIVERKLGVYNLTATNPNAEKEKEEGSSDTIDDYIVSRTKISTLKMYKINNESVPYVSFSDYVNSYINLTSLDEAYIKYDYEFDGSTVTVTNPGNGSYLTFDVNNRIVTYHDFSFFSLPYKDSKKYFFATVFGVDLWNESLTTYEYYEGVESVSFDLSKYSISDYVHHNEVYLPFDTMRTLFGVTVNAQSITYSGDAIYGYIGNPLNQSLAYGKYIRSFGTEWMDEDYMLSSYNNLALSIDMTFYLDERQSRVEKGKVITYGNDALTMLEPYKERLISTELDVANDAMCEFFANELDDGGHSCYYMANLLTTKKIERTDVSGKETQNTLNTEEKVKDSRKEKGIRTADVLHEAVDPNGYYKEFDDTAYIQFDEFTLTASNGKDYSSMDINENNYYYDTITLFKYANDKIQANDKIKNVIIDLSANGGGTVFAEEYIASWACGGIDFAGRYNKTGEMLKAHIEADVNFDGVFDEKDYLSSNINLYVMISNGTFSSGNKLTCDIKDGRKENTHFIGSWTGGGSCCVIQSANTYLGGAYRFSSNIQLGRSYSTYGNFVSNESGVEADYLKFDNSDYASFADIDNIVNYIHNN